MNRILVVDDEKEITDIVKTFLENDGFQVETSYTGQRALDILSESLIHLIILDINLPDIDGIELCRLIRSRTDAPIIMLSARSADIDKILTLGLGADDYMTKPFSLVELSARVKANVRRYLSTPSVQRTSKIYKFDELIIDEDAHTVQSYGMNIPLTSKEFDILMYLCKNPNKVVTKEQIYDHIWGQDEFGEISTVTVHIRKIREKLEKDPSQPKWIKTMWGVGYYFDAKGMD